ncbi:hypothetical protein QNA08_01785 [Chelatococcus sp. SYSU_G07232]|uniref:Uncharacterized protein n=1 Tax=Chelatococcus albus TaxID=3047466 RepID=A0ABT7AC72_9HYPH|nr:hypothetical protein [Chelatococcus sp. SYSU_G07232]MDJ1156972.1 hypothetical protein [Chelatococcus sp. SYSU_G07232]
MRKMFGAASLRSLRRTPRSAGAAAWFARRRLLAVAISIALVLGLGLGKAYVIAGSTARAAAIVAATEHVFALSADAAERGETLPAPAGDKRPCLHGILPTAPACAPGSGAMRLAPARAAAMPPSADRSPPLEPPKGPLRG